MAQPTRSDVLLLDVLKQLDAVVIDLQDAGVPFFTYEVTMGYFLEAAAQAGIEVFVLDRPNPVTGSFVQGLVVTHEPASFKGYFPLPARHGMTMGELANLFNRERAIHARLTVVAMEGWQRGDWYDATGLAWVNPSPNLRSLNRATLYPGVALVEGTNVSVGRGTDTPFEVVGAPWIDARQLRQMGLPLKKVTPRPGARNAGSAALPASVAGGDKPVRSGTCQESCV